LSPQGRRDNERGRREQKVRTVQQAFGNWGESRFLGAGDDGGKIGPAEEERGMLSGRSVGGKKHGREREESW
jgi:hypothetical protein